MEINVSQLLKEPVGSKRTYRVDESAGDAENTSRVEGTVGLVHTDRSILAQGTLNTEVELTCSRCLGLFICQLAFDIEEEYFPTRDVFSGAPVAAPQDSGSFTIDEHHVIDLTEAIRQYVLLATPMKPLCSAECAGLCPTCGHNLNQGPCNCPPQEIDPRWAKLYRLAQANDEIPAERQQGRE
jgi:uncharacterized protein